MPSKTDSSVQGGSLLFGGSEIRPEQSGTHGRCANSSPEANAREGMKRREMGLPLVTYYLQDDFDLDTRCLWFSMTHATGPLLGLLQLRRI